MDKATRHIVSISGGKDSSAMAVYLNDREYWRKQLGKKNLPPVEPVNFEYVFSDTDKELPETYEWLDKLERYLQKPIIRLNSGRGFDHWLKEFNNFLPSYRDRWCTSYLKIKPFEKYVGDDEAFSYIGLRADEKREGYKVASNKNLIPVYPFKEDGLVHDDILQILQDSGLGYPTYYKWRTRSGCFFCFFQRKIEWVGLLENHPHLFEQAKKYEKHDPETGKTFSWSSCETLEELSQPERVYQIKRRHARKIEIAAERKQIQEFKNAQRSLFEFLPSDMDAYIIQNDEDDDAACLICE